MSQNKKPIHIIGGGLAGSEAAWQAARAGVPSIIHEMRPKRRTEVHKTDGLAELVCSNSFRSDDALSNAVGLLHLEMRRCGSLVLAAADANKIPAGGALAVDRQGFSDMITQIINEEPLIKLDRIEIKEIPVEDWQNVIVATGPLTSENLSTEISKITSEDTLAFFDAIAPIIYRDSINFEIAWFQSRYDKGNGADYINLPMDKNQYHEFLEEINKGDKTEYKSWEKTPYFEGCLPIEVMVARGSETLRFGPLKPVGLTNPRAPTQKPYAIVQLRQDNALGTLFNMVGFQTKLKYSEQTRIFRMIPGLEEARFARLGGLHRNTFLNSPLILDSRLHLKKEPRLRFAGQITGVEGYVESAAMGLLAGRFSAAEKLGSSISLPPVTTALGALLNHITTGADSSTFQPMNINFGLFPPPTVPEKKRKLRGRERKLAYTARANTDLDGWLSSIV